MARGENIINKRFGRLTVIDFDHMDRGAYYLCECDCGNRKVISRNNLVTGNSTSCGCKKYELRTEDITGKRFGRLTVLGFDHMDRWGSSYWMCECDCGDTTVVSRKHLLDGHVTSCGCWNVDSHVTHGFSDNVLYHTWVSMRQRCNNPKQTSYENYGGRGITVCDDWDDFENFRDWAISNGYSNELTIDRINNDDGYYPENCRWVDNKTQANNRRTNRLVTYSGNTHTVSEWARIMNVNYSTLLTRVKRGNMQDFEEYYGGL